MKVVLFCGGLGTRLRDYSDSVPKPMVPIGPRPVMWHVMKYYAHYGHREFVLCLGYRGDLIKDYFLRYEETTSNDFVLTSGGREVRLLASDIEDWKITFVDTGQHTNVGERLLAVRQHLHGEEFFLANYADGLTDLCLPDYISFAATKNTTATFMAVRPPLSLHVARFDADGYATDVTPIRKADLWVNAGYFVLRHDIFDHIGIGEDLVEEPFHRLIERRQACAYGYEGFWRAMDTFKDKQALDEMYERGPAPWEVWRR